MSQKYYRVLDPVENFKIKLTLREVYRSARKMVADGSTDQFETNVEIGWQEKLYSPTDIRDYLKNKDNRKGTQSQLDTRRQLALLDDKEPGSVANMMKRTMVYTYIDRDQYDSKSKQILDTESWAEPYLTGIDKNVSQNSRSATSVLFTDNNESNEDTDKNDDDDFDFIPDFDERLKKISKRFNPPKFCKKMTICMATDIDIDKLKSNDKGYFWQSTRSEDEYTLCTIKIYNGQLLEVDPGFSGIIEESMSGSNKSSEKGRTLFLSNDTVETGLANGFRLKPFVITTNGGSEFEYSLQNKNDLFLPSEIEDVIKETEESLTKLGPSTWKQDPPPEDANHICTYYINIDKAFDFDGDNVIVVYEVKVPEGWKLRTGNVVDATAEEDLKKAGAADLLADDGYLDGAEAEGQLRGVSQLASILPEGVSSRKMGVRTYLERFDEPTRIFLGLLLLLVTTISLVMGADYPFWIVPCFSLVVILGTGLPGSISNKITIKNTNKFKKIEHRSPLLSPPVAHIGHMLDLSFDVSVPANGKLFETPTVIFQVYQRGFMDRLRVQGYGYLQLPENPGRIAVNVSCWRPIGDINARLIEFFVGGMNVLKDLDHVSPSSLNEGLLVSNRFGSQTETSGTLKVDVSTVIVDPNQKEEELDVEDANKALHVRRTVDDILSNFRKPRVSLLNATAPGALGVLSSSSSSTTQVTSQSRTALASTLSSTSQASDVARQLTRDRIKSKRAGGNGDESSNVGSELDISNEVNDGDESESSSLLRSKLN